MPFALRDNFLLALFYALTGWLALQIAVPPGYAAPLFPPAGVALAALLVRGPRCLPGVFVGAFVVQSLAAMQSGLSTAVWPMLVVPALGATAQAAFGYLLAGRLLGRDNPLDSPDSIVRFVFVVAPLSSLISPTLGTATLYLMQATAFADLPFTWANWWAGDLLGILIMVPLLLVFLGHPADAWRSRRTAVSVPMLIAL
ncbi:MAG TPA: MASE1 domain-containing protein, partial [Azonexus sp.]|nr:MASE1 domain-containing protein [Azonexus sp.]